jgi:hypothetical protein
MAEQAEQAAGMAEQEAGTPEQEAGMAEEQDMPEMEVVQEQGPAPKKRRIVINEDRRYQRVALSHM